MPVLHVSSECVLLLKKDVIKKDIHRMDTTAT